MRKLCCYLIYLMMRISIKLKQCWCCITHGHYPRSFFRTYHAEDIVQRENWSSCIKCKYQWKNYTRGTETFDKDGNPLLVYDPNTEQLYLERYGAFWWERTRPDILSQHTHAS